MQTIIEQQETRDLKAEILKINQSAFIQNLWESKSINNCNFVYILIKIGCFIKILKSDDND